MARHLNDKCLKGSIFSVGNWRIAIFFLDKKRQVIGTAPSPKLATSNRAKKIKLWRSNLPNVERSPHSSNTNSTPKTCIAQPLVRPLGLPRHWSHDQLPISCRKEAPHLACHSLMVIDDVGCRYSAGTSSECKQTYVTFGKNSRSYITPQSPWNPTSSLIHSTRFNFTHKQRTYTILNHF